MLASLVICRFFDKQTKSPLLQMKPIMIYLLPDERNLLLPFVIILHNGKLTLHLGCLCSEQGQLFNFDGELQNTSVSSSITWLLREVVQVVNLVGSGYEINHS